MDKKYIEREKTFNRKEYDKEYKQKMYKQLKFEVKHDFYEMFNNYCADNGINKADCSLVFQDYQLLDNLSVKDNLSLFTNKSNDEMLSDNRNFLIFLLKSQLH